MFRRMFIAVGLWMKEVIQEGIAGALLLHPAIGIIHANCLPAVLPVWEYRPP